MTFLNTAQGVYDAAVKHGANFPLVVVAQWHLESARGTALSGTHNYFGLKTNDPSEGTLHKTKEEYKVGNTTEERYYFKNFESLEECVKYLITLWYKDYKGHKGVNRAKSNEEAAKLLKTEGYATDSRYVEKLLRVMKEYDEEALKGGGKSESAAPSAPVKTPAAPADKKPALLWVTALQDTYLKKDYTKAAADLPESEKRAVKKGERFPVTAFEEIAENAHDKVELGFGAGTWYIFGPHWTPNPGDEPSSKKSAPPESGSGIILTTRPDWKNFSQKITENLTVGEVLRYDARRAPARGSWQERNILDTAWQFQKIRNAWGSAIGITSFHRPEPFNQQVGGVPGSYHTRGQAIDIYPKNGQMQKFYSWMWSRWTGGFGDGRPRGFIHLDTRGGGGFAPGAGRSPSVTWLY